MKTKFAVNTIITTLFFSALLFVSAGRIDYTEGWVYLLTTLITTALNILFVRSDDELMKERSSPGEGTKNWDKAILGVSLLTFIATMIAGGLDSGRYHPSVEMDWGWMSAGVLMMVGGQLIFLIARNTNRFFSTVVRIQRERGHMVCDTGLYAVIRHPGYLGMIISNAGIPFVLRSEWSLLPAAVSILLMVLRTHLEDRTLKAELTGYEGYTLRVRARLVPGIW